MVNGSSACRPQCYLRSCPAPVLCQFICMHTLICQCSCSRTEPHMVLASRAPLTRNTHVANSNSIFTAVLPAAAHARPFVWINSCPHHKNLQIYTHLQIAARPRCTAARAAAVAIAVLLTAAPACADVPSINSISVGGRAPGRPARPARPGRAPRPPRPGRPGRPSRAPPPDATDAAAPQPAPSEPAIEPPPGADPPPPPTDVSGGAGHRNVRLPRHWHMRVS